MAVEKTVEFKDYLPACFSTKLNQIMGSFHGFQIESSRKLTGEKKKKKAIADMNTCKIKMLPFLPQSQMHVHSREPEVTFLDSASNKLEEFCISENTINT